MYESYSHLFANVDNIEQEPLRTACIDVLNDPRFQAAPASVNKHHCFNGGLLRHTSEVMQIAKNLMKLHEHINGVRLSNDVIATAVVFHDFGKTWDYEQVPGAIGWRHTLHYDRIGHLSRSAMEFQRAMIANDASWESQDHILHCILSHHGRKEWGSPRTPRTPEARILHQADMASVYAIENRKDT